MGYRRDDRPAGRVDPQVLLVQLPFPSQDDPLPVLSAYYERYGDRYSVVFPEYAVGPGDLWEAPLWVAHLDGAIAKPDTSFVDLSGADFDVEICTDRIAAQATPGARVFLSPLAQNFALAVEVSRQLRARGLCTVIGGNMADLASPGDFTHVYTGLVKLSTVQASLTKNSIPNLSPRDLEVTEGEAFT